MNKIPLFVEICAGLASFSRYLQHGKNSPPPISRMGRKWAYCEAIAKVMGLRPRQGAARYLWAEADSDVAALLAAYTQPEAMRRISDTIRSWIPCPYGPHEGWCARCKGTGRWDARDLWEVLRREKRRGLWEGDEAPEDVAMGLFLQSFQFNHLPLNYETAGFMTPNPNGGRQTADRGTIADRISAALPWPPVLIAQDARIEPGEVAGWMGLAQGCYRRGEPDSGFDDEEARGRRSFVEVLAADLQRSQVWPPVHITPDATIQPPQIPPGTVVYLDPPYANTTGYKHNLDRAEVIAIAERWQAAGARVYISEAEPIEIKGWHHVNIGGERKGQARTFSKQQDEWLTCSHPPAWTPPKQGSMF